MYIYIHIYIYIYMYIYNQIKDKRYLDIGDEKYQK